MISKLLFKPGHEHFGSEHCHDVDECLQRMDNCHHHATCGNVIGLSLASHKLFDMKSTGPFLRYKSPFSKCPNPKSISPPRKINVHSSHCQFFATIEFYVWGLVVIERKNV